MSELELTVHTAVPAACAQQLDELCAAAVTSRIADQSLWPRVRSAVAAWATGPQQAASAMAAAADLRAELAADGMSRVLLIGMGGCGIPAALFAGATGTDLNVLSSTDPGQVRRALADLHGTTVVVASKSGRTVETDALRRAAHAALLAQGLAPRRQMVAITDIGSPLAELAADYRALVPSPAGIVGHFAAFTAFGLTPAVLAGGDCARLIPEAVRMIATLRGDWPGNPALQIAAYLATAIQSGIRAVVIADNDPALPGLADWLEHLIAASIHQLLPVVVADTSAPGFVDAAADVALLTLGQDPSIQPKSGFSLTVDGPLGALVLTFEYALAALAHVLGENPFRQVVNESYEPDIAELIGGSSQVRPQGALVDGIAVIGAPSSTSDLSELLAEFLGHIPPQGYLSVQAYLDSQTDNAARLRELLAARTDRPVTFGWGPAHLHTTGEFHQHSPIPGAFLQLLSPGPRVEVPGTGYSFSDLQQAQARAHAAYLAERGYRVLSLLLPDRAAGLDAIARALLRGPKRGILAR